MMKSPYLRPATVARMHFLPSIYLLSSILLLAFARLPVTRVLLEKIPKSFSLIPSVTYGCIGDPGGPARPTCCGCRLRPGCACCCLMRVQYMGSRTESHLDPRLASSGFCCTAPWCRCGCGYRRRHSAACFCRGL